MPPITRSTPNRKTRLRFNNFQSYVSERPVFVVRDSAEMGKGELGKRQNVEYVPGIGLRLANKTKDVSEQWDNWNSGVERAGSVPSGYSGIFTNIRPTLTGVTSSVAPGTQSAKLYTKKVAAGASHAKVLTSDAASFVGPSVTPITDSNFVRGIITLDRVFVSTANHEPDQPLTFVFLIPGNANSFPGAVCATYFCGPAGADTILDGYGQYCLVIGATGACDLYERGELPGGSTVAWRRRCKFKVKDAGAGDYVYLTVSTDCSLRCGEDWTGKTISFKTSSGVGSLTSSSNNLIETASLNAINAIERDANQGTFVYNAPNSVDRPVTLEKCRVDSRRDMHVSFNVFDAKYAEAGEIYDMPFDLQIVPSVGGPDIFIDAYMDRPTGTDINVKLYAIDSSTGAETELTGTETTSDCAGTVTSFPIPGGYPRKRQYRLRVLLTGDGDKTPTLKFYVARRDPVIQPADDSAAVDFPLRESGKALPQRVIRNVSISGTSRDPGSESATVELADLTGQVPEIRERSGTPIDIDVLSDDGTLLTRLFRGSIASVTTQRLRPGNQYPKAGAWTGSITCSGEFQRLNEQLAPARLALWDTLNERPMKATDAIRYLLEQAGEPDARISIPDLDTRLLAQSQNDNIIEPDTPIGDVVQRLCVDYLGGFIIKDENAGTDGLWKPLLWKRPPYNHVLRFETRQPSGSARRLRHVLGAYGSYTAENDQVVQILPTFARTETTERAECNMIVVIGGASDASAQGIAGSAQLCQVVMNVQSYNAMNLADTHPNYPSAANPDFLGRCVPAVIRDPSLSTPRAVNFIARRAYDIACFARQIMTFRTIIPLITDVSDTDQTRARIPRIGDMVEVVQPNGDIETWIISRCSPSYRKAGYMWGEYELVTTSRINEIAIPSGGLTPAKMFEKLTNRMMETIGQKTPRYGLGSDGGAKINKGAWSGLPSVTMPGIQDLDPDSANFGDFEYMEGYDPEP
jgi:hypothetical protein